MSQWGKDDEDEDAVTYQLITIREVPMIIPLLENLNTGTFISVFILIISIWQRWRQLFICEINC